MFYAYVEYATARWRASGDSPGGFATTNDPATGKAQLRGFTARGTPHIWSLTCDPNGNGGGGSLTVTIDDQTAVCLLDPNHKQDGATFDRFGLLNIPKSYDQGGEVRIDDIAINGQAENFDADPSWEAVGNRRTYTTEHVRPRFDFGFSPTRFAGGERAGELGGVIASRLARTEVDTFSPTCKKSLLSTIALAKVVLRLTLEDIGKTCISKP